MLNSEKIRQRLAGPRDARTAWARFAPELTYGRHRMPPPHDAKKASVLVLLYQEQGSWRVPLIERTADVTVHSGQVCFPGGQAEGNETPEETALREFEEELGAPRAGIELCGRLTGAYVFASNFFVTPCVAVTDRRPAFAPSTDEVANLLEPELVQLLDPAHFGHHEIHRSGLVFRAPHIECQGRCIWGATSMILGELFQVLQGLA